MDLAMNPGNEIGEGFETKICVIWQCVREGDTDYQIKFICVYVLVVATFDKSVQVSDL